MDTPSATTAKTQSPQLTTLHNLGVASTDVRARNAELILRKISAQGAIARSDLASSLELNAASVTRITRDLLKQNFIIEGNPLPVSERRGRPLVPLMINPDASRIIGVHIGTDFLGGALLDMSGTVRQTIRLLHAVKPSRVISEVGDVVQHLLDRSDRPVDRIVIACGGWVDPHRGVVRRHAKLNWTDVDLHTPLKRITTVPVLIESSVRAHAYADILFGHAGEYADFLHVFVGNIIEAALVINGEVRTGVEGFSGDIGSWPATLGSHQGTADEILTDDAVVHRARKLGLLEENQDFETLISIALTNSDDYTTDTPDGESPTRAKKVRQLLEDRARGVGQIITQTCTLTVPRLVIVSAGVVALPEHIGVIATPIRHAFPHPHLAPRVQAGAYGTTAVSRAAAAAGFRSLFASWAVGGT